MNVDLYIFFIKCIKLPYQKNQHACLINCIVSFQKFVPEDVCSMQEKKSFLSLIVWKLIFNVVIEIWKKKFLVSKVLRIFSIAVLYL